MKKLLFVGLSIFFVLVTITFPATAGF